MGRKKRESWSKLLLRNSHRTTALLLLNFASFLYLAFMISSFCANSPDLRIPCLPSFCMLQSKNMNNKTLDIYGIYFYDKTLSIYGICFYTVMLLLSSLH